MTQEGHFIRIVPRPMPTPRAMMPLAVRTIGYGRYLAGDYEDRQLRYYTKLMWCIEGQARMRFSDQVQILHQGEVAVMFPNTRHYAQAYRGPTELKWITMDGQLSAQIVATFGFQKEGIYQAAPPPETEFEKLRQAIKDISPDGECRAGSILYDLLAHTALRKGLRSDDSLVASALEIMNTNWKSTTFNVESVARQLQTHRSSLSRQFNEAVGIPPKEYLNRLRMQHALTLLQQTNLRIADIAMQCGYDSQSYFARIFRKKQGLSPLAYRRQEQVTVPPHHKP